MMKERNINIDFIKIWACFGVVALHTININLGVINRIIVLLATMSIPFFFLINGYLMFNKENITYSYAIKRVIKILIVCFSWEALHAIAYYLYYHEWRNFLYSFVLDFFQKGLFFHFWFMGALIIINIAMPSLKKLEESIKKYTMVLFVWGGICLGLNIVSLLIGRYIQLDVIQTFRVWTWFFYFMLGGLLREKTNILAHHWTKRIIIVWVITLIVAVGWQWILGVFVYDGIAIEAFYGSVFVIIAVLMTFLIGMKIKIPLTMHKSILSISTAIMGIYIVHPFVLAVIKKFIPLVIENAMINVLYWIVTIVISYGITWIISKIPVLKELIKI